MPSEVSWDWSCALEHCAKNCMSVMNLYFISLISGNIYYPIVFIFSEYCVLEADIHCNGKIVEDIKNKARMIVGLADLNQGIQTTSQE